MKRSDRVRIPRIWIVLLFATALINGAGALDLGFVPIYLHYKGDVRSSYMSRGKISEDRPVQSNMAEIGIPLEQGDWNFGELGFWHYHFHSLSPRLREKRDRYFAEVDWGVWYAYKWKFAEEWALSGKVMPRWFTLPFWHVKASTVFEWYTTWSLDNPYVTPSFLLRSGVLQSDYLYLQFGLSKGFGFWNDFSVTPGVYIDLSDQAMKEQLFGSLPDGERYQCYFGTLQFRLPLDYRLTENIKLFARLEQMLNVNPEARRNMSFCNHPEWTIFTVGVDMRF